MTTGKFLYGCGADWFYATGHDLPDPAAWYQAPSGATHVLMSELEVGRAMQHKIADHIHSFGDVRQAVEEAGDAPTFTKMLQWFLAQETPGEVQVPADFPAGLYESLKALGVPLQPVQGAFFPGRAVKTAAEIELERKAQATNQLAFGHAFNILKQADIAADNTLMWQGEALTSEILQQEMNITLLAAGCVGFNGGPIVAGGAQGADPHERGTGPLKAYELIVMDCFPQHGNHYNGDLTRTVIKGQPTDWQRAVYEAVRTAQQVALDMLKPGIDGQTVHQAVAASIASSGFPTGKDDEGRPYGFFHGTGHGVGLEVHDLPAGTISGRECLLEAGHISSVEPGLYYPPGTHADGFGGCRIEDVVVITEDGMENLTTLAKDDWIFD